MFNYSNLKFIQQITLKMPTKYTASKEKHAQFNSQLTAQLKLIKNTSSKAQF